MQANLDSVVTRARTDAQALGELYEVHYGPIYRYCRHRLYARDSAEEVTSAVFLKMAEGIGEFRGSTEAEFRAWLYAIATREADRHLRSSERRQRLLEAAVTDGTIPTGPRGNPGHDPDWPAVYQAIQRLKPEDQELITLRFLEGLATDEIAAVVGRSPGAVRTALSRALGLLRDRFAPDTARQPRR